MKGQTLTFGEIKRIMNLHLSGMDATGIALATAISRNTVVMVIRTCVEIGCQDLPSTQEILATQRSDIAKRIYKCASDFVTIDDVTPIPVQRRDNSTDPVDYARYLAMVDEQHIKLGECFALYLDDCRASGKKPVGRSAFYNGLRTLRFKIADGKDKLAYMTRDYQYGVETQIDWCGSKTELTVNGNIVKCPVFVAVWAASGLVFACAVQDLTTSSTIEALNAFWRFSGVKSKILVCDNARALITKHVLGEVVTNHSFDLYMSSMGVELIAAAPFHAQRKNVVEYSVRLIQDRVLDKMKEYQYLDIKAFNRQFMIEVNSLINDVGFRQNGTGTPRAKLFEQYEKPAALPLPARLPSYIETIPSLTVPRSYQIKVCGHYYSVPYSYIGEKVDVIVYPERIEFTDSVSGKKIAEHERDNTPGRSILDEHCPEMHRKIRRNQNRYQTNEEIIEQASKLSYEVERFCNARLARGDTQAKRSCARLINLYISHNDKEIFEEAIRTVLRTSDLRTSSVLEACRSIMKDPSSQKKHRQFEANTFDNMTDDSDQRVSDDEDLTNIRLKGDALKRFARDIPTWDSQLEDMEQNSNAYIEQSNTTNQKEQ